MNLILFGWKRLGKTFFGKKLSESFSLPFLDTDEMVMSSYKKKEKATLSCLKIVQKRGEPFFRDLEKEVIFSIRTEGKAVISLGGGSVLDEEIRDFLPSLGFLVYFDASFETIRERLITPPVPFYLHDREEDFLKWFEIRRKIYESIVAEKIMVDESKEEVILDKLLCLYNSIK